VPQPAKAHIQIHKSYVVTQDEQGLVIVDQHALHERAMFELFMARLERGDLESQRLITPVVVGATPQQVDRLADLAGLFRRIGIEAEPMGPTTIAVHAFPTLLFDKGVDPLRFMTELLERTDDEGFVPNSEEALHEVVDMMSCKAAIKAGDQLGEAEIESLLKLRSDIERSSNCPHGRPTSIRLSIDELNRRFGRS
jgi:DNA mismatch repair protein MutL